MELGPAGAMQDSSVKPSSKVDANQEPNKSFGGVEQNSQRRALPSYVVSSCANSSPKTRVLIKSGCGEMKHSSLLLVKSSQDAKMSVIMPDGKGQVAVCNSILKTLASNCAPASKLSGSPKIIYSSTSNVTSSPAPLISVSSTALSESSHRTSSLSPWIVSSKVRSKPLCVASRNEERGQCSGAPKVIPTLIQTSTRFHVKTDPKTFSTNHSTSVDASSKEAGVTELNPCGISSASPVASVQALDKEPQVIFASRKVDSLPPSLNISSNVSSVARSEKAISDEPHHQFVSTSPPSNKSVVVKTNSESAGGIAQCAKESFGESHLSYDSIRETVSGNSFIPIIFTNAQGETQQINATDVPLDVLSQVSIAAIGGHYDTRSTVLTNSISSVSTQVLHTGQDKIITESKLDSEGRLPISSSGATAGKLSPSSEGDHAKLQEQLVPTSQVHHVFKGSHTNATFQSTHLEQVLDKTDVNRGHNDFSTVPSATQCDSSLQFDLSSFQARQVLHDGFSTSSVTSEHCYGKTLPESDLVSERVAKNMSEDKKLQSSGYIKADGLPLASSTESVLCGPKEADSLVKKSFEDESANVSFVSSETNPKQVEKSLQEHSNKVVQKVACYKCKFCDFLSLSEEAVTHHAQKEHASHIPAENDLGLHCPGCTNVFFSKKSLKVHLTEDHNTADQELKQILQSFGKNFPNKKRTRSVQKLRENVNKSSNSAKPISGNKVLPTSSEKTDGPQSSCKADRKRKILELNLDVKQHSPPSDAIPSDETGKIRVRKLSSIKKEGNSVPGSFIDSIPPNGGTESVDLQSSLVAHKHIETHHVSNDKHSEQLKTSSTGERNSCELPEFQEIIEMDNQTTDTQLLCDNRMEENHEENVLCEVVSDQNLPSPNAVSCAGSSPVVLHLDSSPSDSLVVTDFPEHVSSYFGDGTESENRENSNSSNTGLEEMLSKEQFTLKLPTSRTPQKKQQRNRKCRRKASRISRISEIKQEHDNTSEYSCKIPGCVVKLLSHDNMQYHLRCHIPLDDLYGLVDSQDESTYSFDISSKSRNRFSCPECSDHFKSWAILTNHLWRSHAIDMELYSCDKCNYKSSSLSSMKNLHKKIHGTSKPYLCDLCGKGFKTTKQLRNHTMVHKKRSKVAGKPIQCEICSRSFADDRLLRSHIEAVHNKIRPYMCSECGHTAASRSALKMHLRQHTGDRPYKCDACAYQTSDHNSLRRHKKRHTGDKPYKCPHCAYSSIQSSTFKAHLKNKHPGLDSGMLFSCSKCSFHTVNHEIYLAHVAEHETESISLKPHQLNELGTNFSLATPSDQYPVFISISSDGTEVPFHAPSIEAVVQSVSEAVIPGSHLQVLYDSLAASQLSQQQSEGTEAGLSLGTPSCAYNVKDSVPVDSNSPHITPQKSSKQGEEQITGDKGDAKDSLEELKLILGE